MTEQETTQTSSDRNIEGLKNALNLLKIFLDDFQETLSTSQELLEFGAKTQFLTELEKTISKNPMQNLYDLSNSIDEKVKSIIDKVVVTHLVKNNKIIVNAFSTRTYDNALHYSIVLKEDNFDNREIIYSFFDKYDTGDFSSKYPVYFQITPPELLEKIQNKTEVKLHA